MTVIKGGGGLKGIHIWQYDTMLFKLRQGASMGSNCWMDGWSVGRSVGGKNTMI